MRKLTKLKISEVSLVPEGANDGAKVMIYKMRDPAPPRNRFHEIFSRIDFSKVKVTPPPNDPPDDDDDETGEIDTTTLPPQLEQAIAALILANPALTEQQAAYFLLHNPHGRALIEHLSKRKDAPMNPAEELRDIAKQQGLAAVTKRINDEGTSHGITEHELTKLASVEADKQRRAGESSAQAFARFYSAPEQLELRKALQIAKSTPTNVVDLKPVQPSRNDTVDPDVSAAAYQLLAGKAKLLRATSPQLSEAQAFAKAFTENPDLAAKAHRRPTATTSYAYPR